MTLTQDPKDTIDNDDIVNQSQVAKSRTIAHLLVLHNILRACHREE